MNIIEELDNAQRQLLARGQKNAALVCQAAVIEIQNLNKALAAKFDALPSGISAGQMKRFEAEALQVCYAIEAIPAGEAATKASVHAAALYQKLAGKHYAATAVLLDGAGQPITRLEVIEGLRCCYADMLRLKQEKDPTLTRYPDMERVLDHIEQHGILPK